MEKIFDIAKDKEQKWGKIAQGIDGNFGELSQKVGGVYVYNNIAFIKENVTEYSNLTSLFPSGYYIKKGALIFNNSDGMIAVAEDSSLVGRVNILAGDTVIAEADYYHIQTVNFTGLFDVRIIGDSYLSYAAITTDKVADAAITTDKVAFVSYKNLWDNDTMHDNTYLNVSVGGSPRFNNNTYYATSDFIKVSARDTIITNSDMRFIGTFGYDKKCIRKLEHQSGVFTIEDSEEYVIITLKNDSSKQFMVVKGETLPSSYVPHEPKLDPDLIDAEVVIPYVTAKPIPFGCFANSGIIAENETLNTQYLPCWKNRTLVAQVSGIISEILFGVGYQGSYAKWFKITDTSVTDYRGISEEQGTTHDHGLTLTDLTFISLCSKKDDFATSTLRIMTDSGDYWEHDFEFASVVGTPFVTSRQSDNLDVSLKFQLEDINQRIWMFGDSYFSYNDSRWLYYLLTWRHTANLIDAQGGEAAPQSLRELQVLLETGARPSMVVWCIGMNGGNDGNSAPNASWLAATKSMIKLCSTYGIIPVLATIPSVPNSMHIYMNAWVRGSGYKYIDFAAAVESKKEGDYYWKNWGTDHALLSSDQVHPTSYGAKVLASKAIQDCPELTQNA
jgi:ester hydrolase